jgi:sulfite exporter TauE/SafE
MIGIAVGVAVERLEWTESVRGEVAAWLLITFGLLYFAWGLRRALQHAPHTHVHLGGHHHDHRHDETENRNLTPWVLFTIFVFGPCEPLIPILMYPAARDTWGSVLIVTAVFAITTIGTMLGVVLLATSGLQFTPIKRLERFGHALAGAIITVCGVAIQLGL